MGNSQSDILPLDPHDFDKYSVVERHPQGLILQSGPDLFILKQFISTQSNPTLQSTLKTHHPKSYTHILNVISIQKQTAQNFCSSSFKISAVLEYARLTLKQEIRMRQKKTKHFTTAELCRIGSVLVEAWRELPDVECVRIGPGRVFITEGGVVRVGNEVFEEGRGGEEYCSPERFQGSVWNRGQVPYYSSEKQTVFSIGMTVLSAAVLSDLMECYDFKENCMRLSLLEQKIVECQKQHGEKFTSILVGCLQLNPTQRTTLKKLSSQILQFLSSTEPTNQPPTSIQQLDISAIPNFSRHQSTLSLAEFKIAKQQSFEDNQKSEASTGNDNTMSQRVEQVTSMLTDGSVYSGKLRNGRMQGQGRIMFPTGAYYQGNFCNDLINGYGHFYYQQGQPAYKGEWRNDLFHGFGTHYNDTPTQLSSPFDYTNFNRLGNNWSSYIGHFMNNAKEGTGMLLLTNRQYFEGNFRDNCVEGPGRFYRRDGSVIEGFWRGNRLIR